MKVRVCFYFSNLLNVKKFADRVLGLVWDAGCRRTVTDRLHLFQGLVAKHVQQGRHNHVSRHDCRNSTRPHP